MINLNAKIKMFAVKIIVCLIFKIDRDSRNIEIDLIKVLLQFSIIEFKI